MCLGFVQNFAQFTAVRALLGIAEGGLLPGMVCIDLALKGYTVRDCLTLPCIGSLSVKLLQTRGFGSTHWSFLYGGFIVRSFWRYASCAGNWPVGL